MIRDEKASKKLLSNGVIYLVGSLIAQLVNFLLIPLYTHSLSISEVGLYNFVTSIQAFLSIFITLGIYSGMVRFYNEYDKNFIKNITITFSLFWGVFILLFIIPLSTYIAKVLIGDINEGGKYILIITIISILETFLAIYGNHFSMQFKALQSTLITIGNMLFRLLLTTYFILYLNKGILGLLEGQLYATSIILFILLIFDFKFIKIEYNRDLLKKMLAYGLGLTPGQISVWILTLIDRYILKELIGLASVGLYSMAYKIGMLINPIFIVPFTKILTPIKFKVYKNPDGKEKIKQLFNYYNLIGWFVILALSLFASFTLEILTTPEYKEAYILVPLIALSYYIWGLGEFYALGLHIANKMGLNSLIVTLAAIINVSLNFLLIPKMGISGAAWATILAYFIANIFYYAKGKKYYDLQINFFEPYKTGVITAALFGVYSILKNYISQMSIELILNFTLLLMYLFICVIFKRISSEDLMILKRKLIELFLKIKRRRI